MRDGFPRGDANQKRKQSNTMKWCTACLNVELPEHGLPAPPRQRDVGRPEGIVTQPTVLFQLDRRCRVYVRDEGTSNRKRQNHREVVAGPHVKPVREREPAQKQKPDLLDDLFLHE